MAMLVPTSKPAALATAASIAASAVLVRTLATDLIPSSIQDRLADAFSSLLAKLSSSLTITIDEFDGPTPNLMYKAAESYLATTLTPSTRHIRVVKHADDDSDDNVDNEGGFDVSLARGEQVVDCFQGIQFTWQSDSRESLPRRNPRGYHGHYTEKSSFESRSFVLTLHKKYKDVALKSYLPHVLSKAKAIKEEAKTLKLYTNNEDYWDSVRLRHPATFETVAMEASLKKAVMEDLARFVTRKEYYKRVGKAWKRGYLLYGPPGTGKSSLVAAMANFLRFDVYDLELTEVRNNTALRTLLVGTANRSILVVEDIDCAGDIGPRGEKKKKKRRGSRNNGDSDSDDDDNEKVTLSGLLNFVDGLWSSCGDERIIVFTTNHKDRLDPALLRPGRMDMHIHMSYCTPTGFRVLASNYHSLGYHPLFEEIERLIKEVEITPAEVAEEMMKTDDAEVSLRRLIKILLENKKKNEESEKLREEKRERRNTDCQIDAQMENDCSNSREN